MSRIAIIVGGNVVNVIEAEKSFADDYASKLGGIAVESTTAGPGDTYSGGIFEKYIPPVIIPQEVTRRQARQALYLSGILGNVQAAIDAIPDVTQRNMVQIEWDDSLAFERTRPTLVALATALGLSSEDLDNLFIQASKL